MHRVMMGGWSDLNYLSKHPSIIIGISNVYNDQKVIFVLGQLICLIFCGMWTMLVTRGLIVIEYGRNKWANNVIAFEQETTDRNLCDERKNFYFLKVDKPKKKWNWADNTSESWHRIVLSCTLCDVIVKIYSCVATRWKCLKLNWEMVQTTKAHT